MHITQLKEEYSVKGKIMINKIRYAIKKKKIQLYLLIKNAFEDEKMNELNRKEKIKGYIKKCICHPIILLKTISKKKI